MVSEKVSRVVPGEGGCKELSHTDQRIELKMYLKGSFLLGFHRTVGFKNLGGRDGSVTKECHLNSESSKKGLTVETGNRIK